MMPRSWKMSIEAHGNSQAMHRTGWILSGIVIAFMAADAGSTLLAIAPIKKAAARDRLPARPDVADRRAGAHLPRTLRDPDHQRARGDHPNRISRRRDHEPPSSGRGANSTDDRGPPFLGGRVGR